MWISRAEVRRLVAQTHELKARVAELEGDLRFERERNRKREDDLVNQVIVAAGRRAIERAEPKNPEPKQPPQPKPLNALDEARLLALRDAAVQAGRSPQEADKLFEAQRNGQHYPLGLPDEPYVVPTV